MAPGEDKQHKAGKGPGETRAQPAMGCCAQARNGNGSHLQGGCELQGER